ncbi:MAG TPA: FAD-binding oxidoreductase [Phenylobacterium sp.]|uniref:NAD(P)/FAD-dependent oxidoreductase n=1 Tax=Phenylobacterium sp. TaxID=1871053 RepID=UPI002D6BE811|nr:FAD-binding oxidoreductase [Phenylobacterium sp.]HZZ67834.1 FAD-binding oxidoreductase [Phenylobacterium sp.]
MPAFDFLIVGSGIAGAGAAYELAEGARVLLLEREDAHGYHTTGRSAALYSEVYGNPLIRGLTRASRAFFEAPPEGFAATPLLNPRPCLYVGRLDQADALAALLAAEPAALTPISREEVLALVPVLRPGYVGAGALETGAMDADVEAIHQGFLRGAKARGADIRLTSEVVAIAPIADGAADGAAGGWSVRTASGEVFEAAVVVNAAGAWADQIAGLAGAALIGLTPMRRTAVIVDAPPGVDVRAWPMVIDVDEEFYFKPDAGRLLASPADETPTEPHDAWAEEMDIAICIERVQTAADIPVQRIARSWAGLRSFVADRSPVIGFDAQAPGFFWLAGQGGYGVQTAPAAARAAAALARRQVLPADIAAQGVTAQALSPARLRTGG